MSEVKWIKIAVNIFDDEKIRLLESLPEADTLLIIWLKLLVLAGKCNSCGVVFLARDIPYNEEMLATVMRRPLNTVRMALEQFRKLRMIDMDNDFISITNWGKHQNFEALEKMRADNNKRVANYRERLKLVGNYNYQRHYNFVATRDMNKCVYCGTTENLVLDHLIPVISGGDNEPDNLVLACKACNCGKAGRMLEDTRIVFSNPSMNLHYQKVKKRIFDTSDKGDTSRDRIDKDLEKETDKNKVLTPDGEEDHFLHQLLMEIFCEGYKEIYGQPLAVRTKETKAIQRLETMIKATYKDSIQQDQVIREKCALLRTIAETKHEFQNWKFIPSQLLFRWNDLVPGCVRTNGKSKQDNNLYNTPEAMAARAQEWEDGV